MKVYDVWYDNHRGDNVRWQMFTTRELAEQCREFLLRHFPECEATVTEEILYDVFLEI